MKKEVKPEFKIQIQVKSVEKIHSHEDIFTEAIKFAILPVVEKYKRKSEHVLGVQANPDLSITIHDPEDHDQFKAGRRYWINFTPVE